MVTPLYFAQELVAALVILFVLFLLLVPGVFIIAVITDQISELLEIVTNTVKREFRRHTSASHRA
jgi:predicted PurR-regulated permease PerM